MILYIFVNIYLLIFAVASTAWFIFIFLIPLMTLSAIQFGIQQIEVHEKVLILRNAIFFQSPLILWTAFNHNKIANNEFASTPKMKFIETIYILLMIWFFTTISLKAIQVKSYYMLFNPLIVLISLFFTIISLIVITCEISYIWGRHCYFKLLSYW